MDRCDDIAKQRSESTARVSELEVSLVKMRPPTQEKPITAKWIRGMVEVVKKKMVEGDKLKAAAEAEVAKERVRDTRGCLHLHQNKTKCGMFSKQRDKLQVIHTVSQM